MRKFSLVTVAALAIAGPAHANTAKRDAAHEAHMVSLSDQNYQECAVRKDSSPEERVRVCELALKDLDKKRARADKRDPGILANFDLMEGALYSGMAVAYAEIDRKLSDRLCMTVEKAWTARQRLLAVSPNDVSPGIYATFQDVPQGVIGAVQTCRTTFGTPSNGAPLPTPK